MELNKWSGIAQEKLTLIRRELQEIVVLTSKLTTQLEVILTSKDDHLINSFGIITIIIPLNTLQVNPLSYTDWN